MTENMAGRLLYNFLCSFPYMVLILFSFRGHWRFKKSVTYLIVFAAVAFQLSITLLRFYCLPNVKSQFWVILDSSTYIAFIFAAIKDRIGKLVFTVLVLTNIGTFVIMCAKFIESIFFPSSSLKWYNLTYHPFVVLVLAAVLPAVYLLVFKDIAGDTQSITPQNQKTFKHPWRYLWLIPAIFYLIWMQHYYAAGGSTLENSKDLKNIVFLFVIDAGSVLVYRIIVKSTKLYENNLSLLAENHALSIQRLQYDSLNDRLENMRRTRHDLRHHTALLKQIRLSGDLSALDELIEAYMEQNCLDQPLIFCENETVNILLAFYSEKAYKNNISFSLKADIPEDIFADKKDLAVIFGNILENATDACKDVDGERFVDLVAAYKTTINASHCLTLSVKNSFVTAPALNENGVFSSTKHKGEGIGISSVKCITEKYDGACSFTHEDNVFTVSVILYEQQTAPSSREL